MPTTPFLRLVRPKTAFVASLVKRIGENALDSTPKLLHGVAAAWPRPATQLVCVYRYENAANVERLLRGGVHSALWALDRPHPKLAALTVGSGPGGRFELLNRLSAVLPEDDSHLVVTDDDVTFDDDGLDTLLRTVAHLHMDLAQPAHGPLSTCSWEFGRFQKGTIARRTLWVEIGPTLVFSPRARRRLLPFPADTGMGWGLEAEWHQAAKDDLVLAIVDGVRIRHRGHVGAAYDRVESERANAVALAAHGIAWNSDMQVIVSRWLRSALEG